MSSHRVNTSIQVALRRASEALRERYMTLPSRLRHGYADSIGGETGAETGAEYVIWPPAQNIQAECAPEEAGVPFRIHPSEAITPTDVPGVVDFWEDGAHITTLDLREDQ